MALKELTPQYIEERIKVELGGQTVNVELDGTEFAHIIDDALEALGTWMPVRKFGVLAVSATVQKYELDEGTYGNGIISITRSIPNHPIYYSWPFPDPYVVSVPLSALGDYALTMAHFKEAQHLFGGGFRWQFDKYTGILLIRSTPVETGNYIYIYIDYPALTDVKGRRKWFMDYCLAKAKMIIGNKYRKFRGFPGTENQVELNTDMYQEGSDKIDELMESITQAGTGMTPPVPAYRHK